MKKIKFKNIKSNELPVIYAIICQYTEELDIKTSNLFEITVGAVLYELSEKIKKLSYQDRKKYNISLPVYHASALHIAMQNSKLDDEFSKHIIRKICSTIHQDFFNRI